MQQLLSSIQGEKLLIVDACYSGALIGRGISAQSLLPGSRAQSPVSMETPFLADSSIHVLTSASGFESSWYYDSEGLTTGAVSYFASALSSGLGLYGKPEADMNNNGEVTLEGAAALPERGSAFLFRAAALRSGEHADPPCGDWALRFPARSPGSATATACWKTTTRRSNFPIP